jgi:hypothetical protein
MGIKRATSKLREAKMYTLFGGGQACKYYDE